jgi:hypothetical protein
MSTPPFSDRLLHSAASDSSKLMISEGYDQSAQMTFSHHHSSASVIRGVVPPSTLDDPRNHGGDLSSTGLSIDLVVEIVAAVVAVAGAGVGVIVHIRVRSPPTVQANNEIPDDIGDE